MEEEAAAGDIFPGNTDGEGERLPKPSLFPLFHLGDAPAPAGGDPPDAQNPLWLRNASFTVDVASLPTPAQTSAVPLSESGDSSSGEDGEPAAAKRPAYELVASSSGSEDGAARGKRRRRRRRKRERESDAGLGRKSGVDKWAGRSDANGDKGYYFDGKGDRDNLAFGSLYRMDVARYKSHHATIASGLYPRGVVGLKRMKSLMDADEDVDSVDHKLRDHGRYYSVKYVTLDHMKDLKRLRINGGNKVSIFPGDLVPLNEGGDSGEHADSGPSVKIEREESWEDEILRKTKEFNKMSRECPHDELVWLAFAEFQDKIAARQPQKSARLQTLEKKISILEKAVEINPKNEELILRLLKAYQGRDSAEVVTERWQRALMQHSGSCRLWKEYLWFCQGDFSKFKVSDIRKGYGYAIQALSSVCLKLSRQSHEISQREVEPTLAQLETGLVDIFVGLCRFEWQSGYQELATGLFQAQIEYSLFCPSLFLTGQSKQRLFEHFWNSSGSRVGEDGAIGWAMWLEKEEDVRQKVLVEKSIQEEDVGGWTGWSEFAEKLNATSMVQDGSFEHIPSEEAEEKSDVEGTMVEAEDVETLLKSLGVDVGADVGTDVKDPMIWFKWSDEELKRDSEQWIPARGTSVGISSNSDAASTEDDEQISRIILFDDISEFIFSLCSEEAKYSLVFQFIDFFGGKISRKVSTNSQSWMDYILSLDLLPHHFLKDLRKLCRAVTRTETGLDCSELENVLGSSGGFLNQTILSMFLRNAILLCLEAFPRNYILQEALLFAKELSTYHNSSFGFNLNPTRQLAKGLLKNDRHDLLLCGVYARSEAACGNVDLARKVFDMALTSIGGLSLDLQKNGPLLHLWYAEMELANIAAGNDSALSNARIVHILCCLGSGAKYTPYEISPSNLQILRARQGFKEQIKNIYISWAHGCIVDSSIALICCAALLDNLTSGLDAGLVILNEAFCMVLPERRRQSPHLESLFYFSVKLRLKNLKPSNMSSVWKFLLQGLQIYPHSPKILAAFIKFGCLYTVPNKLRRIIDEYCDRKPSVVVTLFALTYELMKCGSQHRIRGLYERALGDDKMQKSVLLWRSYLAHEFHLGNFPAARRIYFRAIHACPWSKTLWVDGYKILHKVLTTKELSDLQEVMRDKELRLRTDIYEILLQEETTM